MYSHYRGRSVGRVIHFLHEYLGYNIAEYATVGGEGVHYGDKLVGTIEWEDDIPHFQFTGIAEHGNKAQAQKKAEVVRRLRDYHRDMEKPTRYMAKDLAKYVERRNLWVQYFQVEPGSLFVHNTGDKYTLCIKTGETEAFSFLVQEAGKGTQKVAAKEEYTPETMVVPVEDVSFRLDRGIHDDGILLT